MNMNRRQALGFGAAAAAFAVTGFRAMPASASAEDAEKMVMEFAGKAPESGKISLNAPEIAENGNTVPITVSVESPMTAQSYVQEVLVLAEQNPAPGVATLHFTPLSGKAEAALRIRLAKTQNVIAVAKMSDGGVFMEKKVVKVTIGGCGG